MNKKEKKKDPPPEKSIAGIMAAFGAVPLDGTAPADMEALGQIDANVTRFQDLVCRQKENARRRAGEEITREEYQREDALILREAALRLEAEQK